LAEELRLTPIRKRLPKRALIPLMEFCEWFTKNREESPTELFRKLLECMLKYKEYFFDQPWPKRFEYEKVRHFELREAYFIFEGGEEEETFYRFLLVILKRLINYEGGLTWELAFEWIYRDLVEYLEKVIEEKGKNKIN